jgi:hypothetical protein
MKIKKIVLMGAIAFLLNSNIALAQEFRGKGDVTFEGGVFSSDPDVDTKRKASDMAVMSAWKIYTSKFTTAKLNAYKQSQSYFETHLEEFVLEKNTIQDSLDANTNTYSVVIAVNFNDVAIDAKLNEGNDKSGPIGAGLVGSKSLFGFLFVAREQSSVKEFDERDTVVDKVSAKDHGKVANKHGRSENTKLDGGYGEKVLTENKDQNRNYEGEIITQHGGSTLKQADDITYRVYSSSDIDGAVSEVLSSNNFEVTPFVDVTAQCHGPKMDVIKKEFSNTDELSPETRLSAIRALKSCDPNMRYFATGTLDVRLSDIDPATGNRRTTVSFKSQVFDISSGLSRVVASTKPIQKSGLGSDNASATTSALINAASEGANEIVNQLNAKRLK